MSGPVQDVEVRLAEIDRRLREIQAELVPGRMPRDTRMAPVDSDKRTYEPREVAPHQPVPQGDGSHRGRSGPLAEALQRARPESQHSRPEFQSGRPEPPPARPEPPLARPEPPLARPEPPPSPDRGRERRAPDPRPAVFDELQSGLINATRELLDGYERAIAHSAARPRLRLTLAAGPFVGTDALHAFEQALAQLPGVREVDVRGFEGEDRAILDVELEPDPG